MIETILVEVADGDESVIDEFVEVTVALADHGTRVILLYVTDTERYDEYVLDSNPDTGKVTDPEVATELAQRNEVSREIFRQLDERDVEAEIVGLVEDKTSAAVVSFAGEEPVDHLVIGGQGRSPTGKAVFGDRAQRILLNAPCPVTYIRHE